MGKITFHSEPKADASDWSDQPGGTTIINHGLRAMLARDVAPD
jgi:hypothetical protein